MSAGLAFTQAIYVLVFVGDKIRQGMFEYVSTPQISDTLNIPKPSVVRILKLLGQEGLIETGAGVRGGVRLARAPEEITLEAVYCAIEGRGPLFRLDHYLNVVGERPERAAAAISSTLGSIEETLHRALRDVTLGRILDGVT